jgi:hypothetical protein
LRWARSAVEALGARSRWALLDLADPEHRRPDAPEAPSAHRGPGGGAAVRV